MAAAPPAADSSPAPPPDVRGPRRWWRVLKATAVTAFVCWQLFFLLVRNPLDWRWSFEDICERRQLLLFLDQRRDFCGELLRRLRH